MGNCTSFARIGKNVVCDIGGNEPCRRIKRVRLGLKIEFSGRIQLCLIYNWFGIYTDWYNYEV